VAAGPPLEPRREAAFGSPPVYLFSNDHRPLAYEEESREDAKREIFSET